MIFSLLTLLSQVSLILTIFGTHQKYTENSFSVFFSKQGFQFFSLCYMWNDICSLATSQSNAHVCAKFSVMAWKQEAEHMHLHYRWTYQLKQSSMAVAPVSGLSAPRGTHALTFDDFTRVTGWLCEHVTASSSVTQSSCQIVCIITLCIPTAKLMHTYSNRLKATTVSLLWTSNLGQICFELFWPLYSNVFAEWLVAVTWPDVLWLRKCFLVFI